MQVSIQLISPASGDMKYTKWRGSHGCTRSRKVSIQLISPASGDQMLLQVLDELSNRFHSINIPSEWGPVGAKVKFVAKAKFPFN